MLPSRIRLVLVSCLLGLSACGSAYLSPEVKPATRAEDGIDVQVVALTPEVIARANASPYRPKSVPAAFFATSKTPSAQEMALALPEPASRPQLRPARLEMTLPPAPPEEPYRIGISDVLLIATPAAASSVEQLTGLLAAQTKRQGYTVQDDGAIAIPDVGRVPVAGLTLEEAEAEIFKALVAAGIDPTFSLEVSEFNSKRVAIGGAVKTPTLAPITLKPLYLEEAIQLAGGVTASDLDYTVIRLFRGEKLYQIPLRRLFSDDTVKKVRLIDGDVVFVDAAFDLAKAQAYFAEQVQLVTLKANERTARLNALKLEFDIARARLDEERAAFQARLAADAVPRDRVFMAGEVGRQGAYTLPFNRKAVLADALFAAQGLAASTGNPTQIYLLRANKAGDAVTAYHLDARNAAKLVLATKVELRPYDIIFVAEQPVTRWSRVVNQITPTLIVAGGQAVGAL